MNGYDAKRQREEILKRLENEQQMAQYRQNQQRANISPLSVINKANGLSKGLFNTGSRLQKAGNFLQTGSNPMWNKFGSKMGEVGSKMQNLSLRPQISNMLSGATAPTTASTMTGAGGSAIGNAIGTGTAALPSTIGATGTGIGAGTGALGGAAGTAAGAGSSALGSTALGSSLLGATGGGTAAGMGAAGATSALGGATAGATGALAAGSMAIPVVGWGVAALAAAKMIKDHFDKKQQKANAKAMQMDANAINSTMDKVNQQKQGVMNDLMQQSQQDAQAMTLPQTDLTQDIMNRAYPNYTSGDTGLTTDTNTSIGQYGKGNIDLYNRPQVKNDDGSISTVRSMSFNDGNNEVLIPTVSMDGKILSDDDAINNYYKTGQYLGKFDTIDEANKYAQQLHDEQDKYYNGTPTGGASSIMDKINNNLKPIQVVEGEDGSAVIPQVEDTKESIMDKIRGGLTNFKAGYDDNSLHGFSEGDMHNNITGANTQPVVPQDGVLTGGAAQTKKTIMNRLGEAVGTGRRLMANPWTQALIAGGVSKAAGGDIDDIAKAAYDYGTAKAKSDQYYKAINPDAKVMPVFNTFDANDYKAKAYNDFNQGRSIITRRQLIALQNPDKSSNEIDEMISSQGLDPNEIISIKAFDTVVKAQQKDKDIDIKKDKNTWQKDQGQQKINIQQQNANTNYARLGETKRANSVREKNQDRNYNFKVEQAKNKAGAKPKKSANTSSMSNKPVQDGITIVNPKTGQRMRSRNGKWEII